ncbi:uncharacterized protein LOC114387176 [Glycine soja]|uniref:uncharacterized protein LOC114387176 n=1 Tax=Glycine soja TaxID=3848 RepID=UPI00103ECCCD|nr:uncharacterized protein LOC114387176 [Glycine soja]
MHEMMPHSQIFQNNQNYAVWTHPLPPYPPENAAVFSRRETFNPHPGRVTGNKRKDCHRTGSGPPALRSGGKGRRIHHPKRIFGRGGGSSRLTPPFAPRNTTSFIIRAKNCGGMVSPPTPEAAIFPAASLSPATFDEKSAKEQWGFNGYGSMKGLIRLRPGNLDSGAGRFEMVYPNSGEEHNNLDKRVSEQDTHIAHLEEQNWTLKERLLFMERQLDDMRRRVHFLETDGAMSHGGEGGAENFPAAGDVCYVKSHINNK